MWYVVDIVFAQKPEGDQSAVICETSNVLFEAPTALDACRKVVPWAEEHVRDTNFHVLGIQHVRSLHEHQPADGTEIGGSFFEERDPWRRKEEIIPDLNEIPTIMFEAHPHTPIKDLVPEATVQKAKKIFGEK